MNDRAKLNMIIGAGIFAIGLAVTGVTYAGSQHGGRHVVVAYGALIIGGLQFLFGLIQSDSPEPERIDVVAGSLAFFIRNPNAPSQKEIAAIRKFVSIAPERIRELSITMQLKDGDLNGFLARQNDRITSKVAEQIVRGAYQVMIADAPRINAIETAIVLGRLVYLSESEVHQIIHQS